MAAVGRRDSFLNNNITAPLCVCVFLLIIRLSAGNTNAITNVLFSGQTLGRDEALGYENSKVSLVMERSCNLVLYDENGLPRWYSHTVEHRLPPFLINCTLSLSHNGRLVVKDWDIRVWISSNANSVFGKYVAVLHPEAELFIYGPTIWAVGEPSVKGGGGGSSSNDINSIEMASSTTNLKNILSTRNVLFSGQRLYNGGHISDNGGYIFILDDCELILKNEKGGILWQTWTHGYGRNCFASLNHKGELAIYDEHIGLVWKNELALPPPDGEYALVMQSNGTVAIYGPRVWSNLVSKTDSLIKMPTDEM